MRTGVIALLIIMITSALFAQDNYEDFVIQESKRSKTGGIAMITSGVLMTAGGAAVLLSDSETKWMGATILGTGLALDVGSIFMFVRSKRILEDARNQETSPISFYIKPNGAQFVYSF